MTESLADFVSSICDDRERQANEVEEVHKILMKNRIKVKLCMIVFRLASLHCVAGSIHSCAR